ncbi:MAG: DUF3159 domain-containing protein [Pseudoclavibacter sp.]
MTADATGRTPRDPRDRDDLDQTGNPSEASSVDSPDAPSDPTSDAAVKAAEAARASALGRVVDGGVTGSSMLTAMGGVRGIIEAIVPGIAFLVIFTITKDVFWSVAVPAALGVVFIVARLVVRQTAMPAIYGLVGAVISGFLAIRSGDGIDYYLTGFWTNGAYGAAFLISVLVGWPLIGVVASLLFGAGGRWRAHARLRRWMTLVTLGWAAFFALRVAVQLPLYFAGNVEALGVTRLLMGAPMYGVLLVVTALFVRSAFRTSGFGGDDERADAASEATTTPAANTRTATNTDAAGESADRD